MNMNIKRIIKEEIDDFDFVNNMPELHGVSFKAGGFDKVYTIIDKGSRFYVDVTWINPANGKTERIEYKRSVVMKLFKNGVWTPIL